MPSANHALERLLHREPLTSTQWASLLRGDALRPALNRALRAHSRRPVPKDPQLIIIGGGVIGSALARAGTAKGLTTLVVTRSFESESFRFGESFTLNTWSRAPKDESPPGIACEQHPGLVISPRAVSKAAFVDGSLLRDIALGTLWASGASVVQGEVTRADASPLRVHLRGGRAIRGQAVIVCTGFGVPMIQLPDPTSAALLKRELRRGERVLGFHEMARAPLASLGEDVLLVGSGPSATAVVEMLWRRPRAPKVTWVTGPNGPSEPSQIGTTNAEGAAQMFDARYAALRMAAQHRIARGSLRMISGSVERVRLVRAGVEVEVDGASMRAARLIWCGGMTADFRSVGPHAPVLHQGHSLGIQRFDDGQRWPIYGVGPALDRFGLGQWPTGPLSEWVRKALTLLELISASLSSAQ